MKEIYLDNSSTTMPCKEAVEAARQAAEVCWGNPSSLHIKGFEAELLVKEARSRVAAVIGAAPDEIYFNSCGTEGDNTALIGAAHALKKRGRRIVTTAVEHPAVLETAKRLEEEGFEVVYINPERDGTISEQAVKSAITPDTILVSVMAVNNETGAVFPISACRRAIDAVGAPALLHTDAVQAYGKLPMAVSRLGVDLLTASAHKIHGIKGCGALYIRKGVHIKPLITGGGQEKGMRSGTESVPLISAFGAAAQALGNIGAALKRQQELFDYTKSLLLNSGFAEINSPENSLPYILNISVPGYRSETLLHFLENDGIYVSSGSACAKGKGSYVLKAAGLSDSRTDSALRISFSRYNTREDADRLAESLRRAVKTIRKAR